MRPLVSVCIPAYNAQRFIAETLGSVLAQTYPNIEVIVSDDASTDKTLDIVEPYAQQGVRLMRQPRNCGRSANSNALIRASSGKYVLKLDADDLIAPSHVERQVEVLRPHAEVVGCGEWESLKAIGGAVVDTGVPHG